MSKMPLGLGEPFLPRRSIVVCPAQKFLHCTEAKISTGTQNPAERRNSKPKAMWTTILLCALV